MIAFIYLHPLMVMCPGLPEYRTLFIDLICNIIAQLLQSILELLLEGVQSGMNVIHGFHSLFTILLNFTTKELG